MTRYMILGGNGVFGVHTALWLLEKPASEVEAVVCVGRNPEKPEPFTLGLGKDEPRYRYHQIHIVFEHDRLMDIMDRYRPEVIVNYAAQGEGAVSWASSWRYFDTNATALARITEDLMKRRYLRRWIQIGTSELYGSVDRPADEDFPLQPSSPYAASKAAADMHLLAISRVLKFPMNIIRPSNAYAPGQLLHRIIPRAVVCSLTGRKLPLHGGGQPKKSYLHARDLARAIWLVSERAPSGRVYNVGPPDPIQIRDLVRLIADRTGSDFETLVAVTPPRLGEDSLYWLDSRRAREELGWQQEISLEDGIDEMIAWGKRYIDALRDCRTDYILQA